MIIRPVVHGVIWPPVRSALSKGGGAPSPPSGFALLRGADGLYLKGADGAYLYGRAA